MTTSNPTWAVVATVDEHPALLKTFVAWHLSLGASQVFLYFDRPDDPAADQFDGMSQVNVVRCDEAYWARHSKTRPARHQVRQSRNATRTHRRARVDWLLHIDADEFLWPSKSVPAHLDEVYPWFDGATVPVAERVFVAGETPDHVFTGPFRRPAKGQADPDQITQRGLTGHAIGKAFSRVGRDLSVSIHRPQSKTTDLQIAKLAGIELLHFDGLTRLQWMYKLLRKAEAVANYDGMPPSPHRKLQIDALAEGLDLHDELKVLEKAEIAALRDAGLILDARFAPQDALAAISANPELLKPDAFDAWLLAQYGDAFPTLKRHS